MGRVPRVDVADNVYHIINRANARLQVFFDEKDYRLFEKILQEAVVKFDMRLLAYCLMPNHFHLVVYPRKDGDIGRFMQWLTLAHTQRWHAMKQTTGTGHLYQGRYKSFIIQDDMHMLTVIRYVERNPLRAKLVKKAQNWRYSSLGRREKKSTKVNETFLAPWPIEVPKNYIAYVNIPNTVKELDEVRNAVNRGKPFGEELWVMKTIDEYHLGMTIRRRGRPKKGT